MIRFLAAMARPAPARSSQLHLEASALIGIERVAKAAGLQFYAKQPRTANGPGIYTVVRDSYLGHTEMATVRLQATDLEDGVRLDVRNPDGRTLRRIDLAAGLSRMQVFDAIERSLGRTYLSAHP